MMAHTLTGTVRGNSIIIDAMGPILDGRLDLEGRRVRVAVEPLGETEIELSAEEQGRLLQAWAEHGPQGPIEDEGDPEFP
jgi:hypothetical protein